jgi:hypothetical protein
MLRASAMTAIVDQLANNIETYINFKDMHHGIAKKLHQGMNHNKTRQSLKKLTRKVC